LAARKKMPPWLTAVLVLVLLALVAVVGMLLPAQQDRPVLRAAVPNVTFEDFPAAPALPAIEPAPSPPPSHVNVKPRRGVALIIDDVGYDLDALRRILSLDVPVAISVLPDSPHAGEAAEMAHEAGQMVMLHLPMEPDTAKYRDQMDAAFLRVNMSQAEMQQTFMRDLTRVPYVEGVNNHMGSHLTRLPDPMAWLMQSIREEGMFFVDSRTTASSVAAQAAQAAGLPWAARQIFLDHHLDAPYMHGAWKKAQVCQAEGRACIIIAHPHPETVAFLEWQFSSGHGLALKPLRQLLHPGHMLAGAGKVSAEALAAGNPAQVRAGKVQ